MNTSAIALNKKTVSWLAYASGLNFLYKDTQTQANYLDGAIVLYLNV
jgi:hypothetical protein